MIKKTIDNQRYSHIAIITRLNVSDNPFCKDGEEETVLYRGKCRVFTDTTTVGSKEMDSNRRKCSIPVRYDEWTKEILDGDAINVRVGNIEYDGIVKDCEPDNNRTLIYWERNRV